MTKIQSKPVPAPTVYVDNFELKDIQIIAYTLIDGKPVDFSINRDEFEKWCDENELRDYERNIPGNEGLPERDVMCQHSWLDIYDGYELMEQFLKAYIEDLYFQESLDFQPALNTILASHKNVAI